MTQTKSPPFKLTSGWLMRGGLEPFIQCFFYILSTIAATLYNTGYVFLVSQKKPLKLANTQTTVIVIPGVKLKLKSVLAKQVFLTHLKIM